MGREDGDKRRNRFGREGLEASLRPPRKDTGGSLP